MENPIAELIYGANDDVKNVILNNTQYYQNTTKGASFLYWAARLGHSQVVENLIRRGVRPDIETEYGETPLLTAAEYGQPDVVRILLATTEIIILKLLEYCWIVMRLMWIQEARLVGHQYILLF